MQAAPLFWSGLSEGWRPPPLEVDEIHLWSVDLDEPETAALLRPLLDEPERQRADRYYFPRDRVRFAVGRGRLRQLCGAYLGTDPSGIRFDAGAHGKPHLPSAPALHFNVAHSEGLALIALGRLELGVDLERIRPVREAVEIARRFFTAGEASRLFALPVERREEAFFHLWTRKEAYLKACGKGITGPLNEVEMTFGPGVPCRLVSEFGRPVGEGAWQLAHLEPREGFVGALAYRGAPLRVRWFPPGSGPPEELETVKSGG